MVNYEDINNMDCTQDFKGFSQKVKTGPVISALNYYKFNNLILLTNNLDTDGNYVSWIKENYQINVNYLQTI